MYLPAAARALLRPPRVRLAPAWAVRLEVLAAGGYLVALAAVLVWLGSLRPLWFDELFTLHLARHPAALWRNLAAGADNNPPLSYLLTAAAVGLFGETPWALRLPAVGGAVAAGLCLYLFVRRRRGPAEALLALTAFAPTAPVWIYFVEARPYGLMVGFAGVALLAWQRAADGGRWWRIAFAASLVGGLATHYYFVVPVLGLAVGELVRTISRRQIDRGVLAGFVVAGLTLAALYPLWGFGPQQYAPGFWAKVKFARATVEEAFQGMYARELFAATVLALAAAAAGHRPDRGGETYKPWETAALAALAAGPLFGVLLGAYVVGAYYYRYTLPAVLGLAGVLAFAVGRAAGAAKWPCVVAAVGFAFAGPAFRWKDGPGFFRTEARDIAATSDFLADHAAGGTVIVENAFDFARQWHYARDRGFAPTFLADPGLAMKHAKADTIDRGLVALRGFAGAPVTKFEDLSGMLADRPVYLFGPPLGGPGETPDAVGRRTRWLPGELAARGISLEPVAARPNGTLYRLRR